MFQIKRKKRSYFKYLSFARQRLKSKPRKDYWIDKSTFFTGRTVRCPNDSFCNIENYSSDETNSKCSDPLSNEQLYGSRETDDEKLLSKSAVLVENNKSDEERSLSPILSGIKSSNERYHTKDKLQSSLAITGFTENTSSEKKTKSSDCEEDEDIPSTSPILGTSTPKKIGANSDVRSPLEFPNFEDLSLEMNKKSVVTYKKVKATRKRRSELVFTKLVGKSLIEDSDLEIVEEPSTSSAPRHLSENEISICIEEDDIEFQEMPKKKDVKGEYSEFKAHSKEVVKIRQPKKNGKEACVLNRLKDSNFWFKAAIASRKYCCYKIFNLKMAPPLVLLSAKPWNEEKDEAATDDSCTEKWFAYNINLWRLCREPAEGDLIYISMEFSATMNFNGRDFILPYFMDRPPEIKFSRKVSLPIITTVYSSCDEESHRDWEENSDDNNELVLTDVVKDNGSQLSCVSRNEEESELFGPLGSDWFSQI